MSYFLIDATPCKLSLSLFFFFESYKHSSALFDGVIDSESLILAGLVFLAILGRIRVMFNPIFYHCWGNDLLTTLTHATWLFGFCFFLVSRMVKNLPATWDTPLQYSCLENSMDRGAWWAIYSLWGCKELDTTEWLTLSLPHNYIFFSYLPFPILGTWLWLAWPSTPEASHTARQLAIGWTAFGEEPTIFTQLLPGAQGPMHKTLSQQVIIMCFSLENGLSM